MSAAAVAVARSGLQPRQLGWAGVACAVAAALLPLPPLLVRSPLPSLLFGLLAVLAGAVVVRGGERRLGAGAIASGVAAAAGGVLASGADVADLEAVFVWSALVAAMLRFATPLALAALGGILSERSGVINIGLEGMMLMGAFFGIFGADLTGSWVAGVALGVVSGGLLALLHAFFAIRLRTDQVVSSIAVNLLALGITGYIFIVHYGSFGTPGEVPRVPEVTLPVIDGLPFFGEAIGQANLLTWVALLLVPVMSIFLFRTSRGLRLRSVGEEPRAADTVGVQVARTRYLAVVSSGMLAALGGAYLSVGFVGSFSQNMTAGRGFIAIAAVIFGAWRPLGTLCAALLFGFSSALAQRLPEFSETTAVLFQALPYVLTLIVVVGVIGRSRPPASLGIPYKKE